MVLTSAWPAHSYIISKRFVRAASVICGRRRCRAGRAGRDIGENHAVDPDDGAFSDRDTLQDKRVLADPGAPARLSPSWFAPRLWPTSPRSSPCAPGVRAILKNVSGWGLCPYRIFSVT